MMQNIKNNLKKLLFSFPCEDFNMSYNFKAITIFALQTLSDIYKMSTKVRPYVSV